MKSKIKTLGIISIAAAAVLFISACSLLKESGWSYPVSVNIN